MSSVLANILNLNLEHIFSQIDEMFQNSVHSVHVEMSLL